MTQPHYYYEIGDSDEAEEMGGATMLAIVSKDFFDEHQHLDDNHILPDMIADTGRQDLEDHLEELMESMFLSGMEADELRTFLADIPTFEERTLF